MSLQASSPPSVFDMKYTIFPVSHTSPLHLVSNKRLATRPGFRRMAFLGICSLISRRSPRWPRHITRTALWAWCTGTTLVSWRCIFRQSFSTTRPSSLHLSLVVWKWILFRCFLLFAVPPATPNDCCDNHEKWYPNAEPQANLFPREMLLWFLVAAKARNVCFSIRIFWV